MWRLQEVAPNGLPRQIGFTFPATDSPARPKDATCPVASECLTWAIETNQSEGVWGGHTPKERSYLRRKWMEETRSLNETQRGIALNKAVSLRREKASS